MLTLNNLSYRDKYHNICFKNLGLTLGDCSLVVIRGGNKISLALLEMVSTLRKPTIGNILYANEDVTKKKHYSEYCEMIQFLTNDDGLKDDLTVIKNLNFWAGLKRSPELVPSAISYFTLNNIMYKKVKELGFIQRKLTSLARLIACQSEIWLLEEPFVGLDEIACNQLASLISSRCQQGGIVIISAQDKIPIENYTQIHIKDFK